MQKDIQTNASEGSQIECPNCKGRCHVIMADNTQEICNVCEGTGIKPDGK